MPADIFLFLVQYCIVVSVSMSACFVYLSHLSFVCVFTEYHITFVFPFIVFVFYEFVSDIFREYSRYHVRADKHVTVLQSAYWEYVGNTYIKICISVKHGYSTMVQIRIPDLVCQLLVNSLPTSRGLDSAAKVLASLLEAPGIVS